MSYNVKSYAMLFGFILFVLSSINVQARPIPAEKRQLIDQIIKLTDTTNVLPLMTNQLTSEILKLLKSKDVTIDKNLVALVQKESTTVIYEDFVLSNKFNEIFYELYDEYFTVNQLKDIVTFYESSAGKRLLKVMPDISQRSMKLAQEHSRGAGLKVHDRLMKRFDEVEEKMQTSLPTNPSDND